MPSYRPLFERFMEKVDKRGPDECWPWLGGKAGVSEYGKVRMPRQRRSEYAHRVSYMLANGAIPAGNIICHSCGNASCVNPAHLYAGTFSDNNVDRINHGRQAGGANKGERHHCAKLNEAAVREIKWVLDSGAMTGVQVADAYGISRSQVSRIRRGESWGHL